MRPLINLSQICNESFRAIAGAADRGGGGKLAGAAGGRGA